MNNFLNKNKYKLCVLAISCVMLITSLSYAFFTASVTNQGTVNDTVATTGIMQITYTDGEIIGTPSNMIPGQSIEKRFKVKNTGNVNTEYVIYLSEVINTFNPTTDLEYKLEKLSTNGYETNGFVTAPTSPAAINNVSISIESNEEQEYKLTVLFKETNVNQDDNKGKKFQAKIQINEYNNAPITLTVHPNNNDSTYTIQKNIGLPFGNVTEPTKTDYEFVGWFRDSNLTSEITPSTIVDEGLINIYAKWRRTMITQGLVDYWPLQGNLNNRISGRQNLETYKGSPTINNDSVYLQNTAIISTPQIYYLTNSFTIIFQAKNITSYYGPIYGYMLGLGSGGNPAGGTSISIANQSYIGRTGCGDAYNIYNETDTYRGNDWHTFALRYNGSNKIDFYIDSNNVMSTNCVKNISSKLYIGGISNSGSSSSGATWGYGNGYYKNVAIYNRALTNQEMENFIF